MRSRLPLLITVFVAILALCACHHVDVKVLVPPNLRPASPDKANTLAQAKLRLQQATPCCSSFADFSYQTMLPWQPQKFELGSGSSVANLNNVHSYFLAFQLPPDAKLPYRIGLKSELNGRWLQSSYLFAPTLVLLDEAFQPIDTQDIKLCEYMGWSNESSGAFGSLKIDEMKARYLVVYSSQKQQTSDTYWEQSPASFSADAPMKMSANGSFKVAHGPDGTIWIGMMNKTYAKAVDNAVCGKPPQGSGVLKSLRTALTARSNGNGA